MLGNYFIKLFSSNQPLLMQEKLLNFKLTTDISICKH